MATTTNSLPSVALIFFFFFRFESLLETTKKGGFGRVARVQVPRTAFFAPDLPGGRLKSSNFLKIHVQQALEAWAR
jgi:hypothetical protein